MPPLHAIAMGLVIVLVDAPFGGYDGVPDPVGWLLALWGVRRLRGVVPDHRLLLAPAVVALLVSAAIYPPVVLDRVDESVAWALSLPQLVFSWLLCDALATVAEPYARRFRVLRTLFIALAVAPAVVIGGGLDALRTPLALAVAAAGVYLVYLLFRASSEPKIASGSG